jgi:hypothetical protein
MIQSFTQLPFNSLMEIPKVPATFELLTLEEREREKRKERERDKQMAQRTIVMPLVAWCCAVVVVVACDAKNQLNR